MELRIRKRKKKYFLPGTGERRTVTEAAKGTTALWMTRWKDKEDEDDREDSEKCVCFLLHPDGIIAWRLFGFPQTVKLADKRGENEEETMVLLSPNSRRDRDDREGKN